MSERQEGNYAWPIASLTPSLSQLNGKNRQGWPRTPCPSNISTALCFLTSKLSQVRQHLHLYPPDCPHRLILCLRNKGRQWGREGWALATGDPGSLGQQKKERHSLQDPSWVLRPRPPPSANSTGHLRKTLIPSILAAWSQNIPAERKKDATMPDTELVCSTAQNPYHRALRTQRTQFLLWHTPNWTL